MPRKTLDALFTATGLILAAVLLVAGSLLSWGSNFVTSQVHDQLAAQRIFFPAAGSAGLGAKEFPGLQQYGGKQLVTGEQAKAYADQFIGKHLEGVGGGKTYSELSAAAKADPTDAAAKAKVDTMFKGETLRGMLLNAYAFGTMGTVAAIAAWASFAAAALLVILALLGFRHLRQAGEAPAI